MGRASLQVGDGAEQVFFFGDERFDAVAFSGVKGLVFDLGFGVGVGIGGGGGGGGEEVGGLDGQAVYGEVGEGEGEGLADVLRFC